ncbi:OsmC family peroxiredoxin, partial [Pseudomonas aeruginosa]
MSIHSSGGVDMKKTASAVWQGGLKDGKGTLSTESGALKDNPYGFNTRFEGAPGTNPEELIGAAHAGCFSRSLIHISDPTRQEDIPYADICLKKKKITNNRR